VRTAALAPGPADRARRLRPCLGYGLYLLHGAALVPRWIGPAALLAFAAATPLPAPGPARPGRLLVPVLACASVLVLPAGASASTGYQGLGAVAPVRCDSDRVARAPAP